MRAFSFLSMSKKSSFFIRFLKRFLYGSGILFLLLLILAFTTLPFWAYYRLATGTGSIRKTPSTIVMLSGAGIPSESGLIRVWYTAGIARSVPEARIILAVPGNISDTLGDARRIAKELILRGVSPDRIFYAGEGRNTRGQALEIAGMIKGADRSAPLTLVTSPEHVCRAVLSFRKAGFPEVSGLPAFDNTLNADLGFNDQDLKGNKYAPPIGRNLQVRYQFWNHLKYEVLVIREYFALSYYKLRGWI